MGCGYVSELSRHVPPYDGHGKRFAMLRAFVDESGTQEGSPVCVIAGYVGGVRRWDEFERAWRNILQREGIEEFHARRFWARKRKQERVSDYRHWTDERAERFLSDLLNIIERIPVYPFAAALVMEEWRRLSLDERRWLTGGEYLFGKRKFTTSGAPNKPYFVPFHQCILTPAKYCKASMKVHFVADANQQIEAWAVRVFQDLKNRTQGGSRLGTLTFANSKETCGLQVADLLAYLTYQFGCRKLCDSLRMALKKALVNARSEQDFKLLDKKGLELLLEPLRSSFPTRNPSC